MTELIVYGGIFLKFNIMPWYFSPVIYLLVIFVAVVFNSIKKMGGVETAGSIVSIILMVAVFIIIVFYSLDGLLRSRLWNKYLIIGLDILLSLPLIYLCFAFQKALK